MKITGRFVERVLVLLSLVSVSACGQAGLTKIKLIFPDGKPSVNLAEKFFELPSAVVSTWSCSQSSVYGRVRPVGSSVWTLGNMPVDSAITTSTPRFPVDTVSFGFSSSALTLSVPKANQYEASFVGAVYGSMGIPGTNQTYSTCDQMPDNNQFAVSGAQVFTTETNINIPTFLLPKGNSFGTTAPSTFPATLAFSNGALQNLQPWLIVNKTGPTITSLTFRMYLDDAQGSSSFLDLTVGQGILLGNYYGAYLPNVQSFSLIVTDGNGTTTTDLKAGTFCKTSAGVFLAVINAGATSRVPTAPTSGELSPYVCAP